MKKQSGVGQKYQMLGFCLLLLSVVVFLFLTGAPTSGAFSWSDSPRHALNGAFVMDLIRAAPFDDPTRYAYNYYSQYPALTILLYPPLLSFLLAPFYAVFGVSHETAIFVLFICYSLLAFGTFLLSRQWFSAPLAFAVSLLLIVSPEIAFWGRMVMLEVPSYAFLVWSAYFFVRHIREERIYLLYVCIGLFVLGAYTKLSIVFISIPYLVVLIYSRGFSLFRDKHSYIILALTIISVLPLVYLTFNFGQANIQSIAGISDSKVSRFSIDGWIWYAKQFPSQIGWPVLVASVAFVIFLIAPLYKQRLKIKNGLFLFLWFAFGYLFFSSIDLKEARHSVFLLLPVVLSVGFALKHIFRKDERFATVGVVIIGVFTLGITIVTRPVYYVDGYKDVVEYVSNIAPKNSNVLFSGYRDGAFTFNMRAYSERPDLSVLRATKLLLKISVRRSLGVEQQNYSEPEINDLINKMGVHYIVAQPDFWTDLDQMEKLQNVLNAGKFKVVRRFKMNANYDSVDKELIVYQNLGEVAKGPVKIVNELPIINRKITGYSKYDKDE